MTQRNAANVMINREILVHAILKGAGNTGDGSTKGQIINWIHEEIGHKKDSKLKSRVEVLLKEGKQAGILCRGKNASRFKITTPEQYQSYLAIKVERIAPKAVSKHSKKKKNTKTPNTPPPNKPNISSSRIFTDSPWNCHDPLHPDYNSTLCEPSIDKMFVLGICNNLELRKEQIDATNKEQNEKRFDEYEWSVNEIKQDTRYAERYTGRRHKLPPIIVQTISALYR